MSDVIGFGSVALPGVAGSFVQLPSIVCDEIGLGSTTGDIQIAGSASPGSAFVTLQLSVMKGVAETAIPTGGNANNLWMANVTATAQTVGFIWKLKGIPRSY